MSLMEIFSQFVFRSLSFFDCLFFSFFWLTIMSFVQSNTFSIWFQFEILYCQFNTFSLFFFKFVQQDFCVLICSHCVQFNQFHNTTKLQTKKVTRILKKNQNIVQIAVFHQNKIARLWKIDADLNHQKKIPTKSNDTSKSWYKRLLFKEISRYDLVATLQKYTTISMCVNNRRDICVYLILLRVFSRVSRALCSQAGCRHGTN